MKKFFIISIVLLIFLGFGSWFIAKGVSWYQQEKERRTEERARNEAITAIIDARRPENIEGEEADVFGDDGKAQILLIGLDKRVGDTSGHCDVIQLVTVDEVKQNITITAVPRGTYSPLPPGQGTTSSDYYVSNACGLGGLEYGIKQIEKIIGVKADYLAVVGFSETLGILRSLQLPTTETLQWLRNRHTYAIGEPQRAHNHSMFIKQMMIKFVPEKKSSLNTPLQYIIYKLIKTDLSFAQTQKIIEAISAMDIVNHPERIVLSMRPLYPVQDIPYDPGQVDAYLDQTLGPIRERLSQNDYSGLSEETMQEKLLGIIAENKNNAEFVTWAYQNNLWLQIEDDAKRLSVQYDLLTDYLSLLLDKKERESVIADYILEMENRGELIWEARARELLAGEIGR